MISMLEGDRGVLRKEFAKLLDWLADEPVPDVVNLPNCAADRAGGAAARGAAAADLSARCRARISSSMASSSRIAAGRAI